MTPAPSGFLGFPPEALTFLAELKANNDRDWFTANRPTYERAIKGPAEAFVAVIGPELEAIAGQSLKSKIFRMHRDVRFSKDKSPYNTYVRIGFSPPDGGHRAGYFFSLEPGMLYLGAGVFDLDGGALDAFRAAVADEGQGGELTGLLGDLTAGGARLDEPSLKRVPAPYPADHPRGELLRHKGLNAWRDITDRSQIESPALLDVALAAFREFAPLNRWIDGALGVDA